MNNARTMTGLALGALLLIGAPGASARRPREAIKCRDQIGNNTLAIVHQGLSSIDHCYAHHGQRCDNLAPKSSAVPNAFTRALGRAGGITNFWCNGKAAVTENYPTGTTGVMSVVGPSVQMELEDSATTLQGTSPPTNGAARRCIQGIGRARSHIVDAILTRTVRCQRGIDRRAASFGAVSPSCLVNAPGAQRWAGVVSRACQGLDGPSVGSCGPLPFPGCIIDSATKTAHDIAVVAYGAKADQLAQLCGNGTVDLPASEECDDGPLNGPNAACTDTCRKAKCGDGNVETGVEDCDNGHNDHGNNFDSATCTATCKAARCGDGIVVGSEQCDDGNTTAGDGCSPNCQYEPVPCPASGTIDVTVTFEKTVSTSAGQLAGFDFLVGYPSAFSLPGSSILPVEDPSDPASRLVLLGTNGVDLYSGAVGFLDCDDPSAVGCTSSDPNQPAVPIPYLRTNDFLSTSAAFYFSFAELPFERIRFDCPSGTEITEADFPCSMKSLINTLGSSLASEQFPLCKIGLPR